MKTAFKNLYNALLKKTKIPTLDNQNSYKNHNKNKKQILIIGWYGVNNFGDELMLDVLLEKNIKNNCEISVLFEKSNNYTFSNWRDVFPYYPPKSSTSFDKIADFFDEIVIGGGAHIDDLESSDTSFIPYLATELSISFIKKKKKVKWISVSSNKSLTRPDYINKINNIIENSQEFSIRDTNTIHTLKEAGINIVPIKLTNDLAFEIENNPKILAVTFVDFTNFDFLVTLTQSIIETLSQNKSQVWRICFLPFYNENHNDVKLYQNILNHIDLKGIRCFIAPEFTNTDSMLLMMRSCHLFVNMRYHATLLSLKYNIPTISICLDTHRHYHNKLHYIHNFFKNKNLIDISKFNKNNFIPMLVEEINTIE